MMIGTGVEGAVGLIDKSITGLLGMAVGVGIGKNVK